MGIWDQASRQVGYWGDSADAVQFDVTTVADTAAATADALFAGTVGDLRIATATISAASMAAGLGGGAVAVRRGSLAELEAAVEAAGGLDRVRLQCQRTLFAGEVAVVQAGHAGFDAFVDKHHTLAASLLSRSSVSENS